MPDWVLKHKTKGHTVRYNNGTFSLIKIKSVRVKDKPYPRLINEYVGIITKDGVVHKKTYDNNLNQDSFIEFGFSYFIYINFRRDLKRAIYGDDHTLKELTLGAAIMYHIFGDVHTDYLNLSYLKTLFNIDNFNLLNERRMKNVHKLSNLINEYLDLYIPNKVFKNILIYKLKNTIIDKDSNIVSGLYSADTIEIIERYGLRYE